MQRLPGSLYDYPHYYDLLFGADWKAEYHFLQGCFAEHARRRVRQVLEPACGTGRLLLRLAQAGYRVTGYDLNAQAIAYCNRRLARHGFRPTARQGDMAHFRLARPADAAFNTINSFRHLTSEAAAEQHLHCLAASLAPGGIYVLGLHLTPTGSVSTAAAEAWQARRGSLTVRTLLRSAGLDRRRRQERLQMRLDVRTPRGRSRLEEEWQFRTYTVRQFRALLGRVPELELVATYDFNYNLQQPIALGAETEDAVFVLRRHDPTAADKAGGSQRDRVAR